MEENNSLENLNENNLIIKSDNNMKYISKSVFNLLSEEAKAMIIR